MAASIFSSSMVLRTGYGLSLMADRETPSDRHKSEDFGNMGWRLSSKLDWPTTKPV